RGCALRFRDRRSRGSLFASLAVGRWLLAEEAARPTADSQRPTNYNPRMLRPFAAALLLFAVAASAAPPKAIAPPAISHPIAMFLSTLSSGGKQKVTFKAAAAGM